MQPGASDKQLSDLLFAIFPHVGRIVCSPWAMGASEVPDPDRSHASHISELGILLAEDIAKASAVSGVAVLNGPPGSPFEEVARAISAAADLKPMRSEAKFSDIDLKTIEDCIRRLNQQESREPLLLRVIRLDRHNEKRDGARHLCLALAGDPRGLPDEVRSVIFQAGACHVRIPPLRDRLNGLIPTFLKILDRHNGSRRFTQAEFVVIDCLPFWNWPGNEEELDRFCARLVNLNEPPLLTEFSLASAFPEALSAEDHIRIAYEGNPTDEDLELAGLGPTHAPALAARQTAGAFLVSPTGPQMVVPPERGWEETLWRFDTKRYGNSPMTRYRKRSQLAKESRERYLIPNWLLSPSKGPGPRASSYTVRLRDWPKDPKKCRWDLDAMREAFAPFLERSDSKKEIVEPAQQMQRETTCRNSAEEDGAIFDVGSQKASAAPVVYLSAKPPEIPEDEDREVHSGGRRVFRLNVGEGCRTISVNGDSYDFGPRQAEIVKILLQHFIATKIPKISHSNVRLRFDLDDRTKFSDVFKGCAAWGVVVSSKRGQDYIWLGSKSDPWQKSQIVIENPDYVTETSPRFTKP